MDLITIELANIERELNQIYTLKKNQRNHKKILLLKQRHQDLIFRMQMAELEETAEENAAENAEEQSFSRALLLVAAGGSKLADQSLLP